MRMTAPQHEDPPDRRSPASVEVLLRTGGLRMHFQPIVSLSSGEITAFEALVRPKRSFAGADALLTAAERQEALPALDRLAHSIALASAPALATGAGLFLNASPSAVIEHGFASRLACCASFAGVTRERVVVEITELGASAADADLCSAAAELRDRGFGVAIDDIGAGHSDLARILRLRPNWLKLDRTLVQHLGTDRFCRSLVAALVRFADQNAIRVVAEGIEFPSHAACVADLGVGLAQGFWFARPLRLSEAASPQSVDRVRRRWHSVSLAA